MTEITKDQFIDLLCMSDGFWRVFGNSEGEIERHIYYMKLKKAFKKQMSYVPARTLSKNGRLDFQNNYREFCGGINFNSDIEGSWRYYQFEDINVISIKVGTSNALISYYLGDNNNE